MMNIFLFPITFPLSLPFELLSKGASLFFVRETRVIVPSNDFNSFLMVPDESGHYSFPLGDSAKDLGTEGVTTRIQEAWDGKAFVTYRLMMKGVEPSLQGQKYFSRLELEGLPIEVLKDLMSEKSRFEGWKGMKIEILPRIEV
jgi:hypothetical protein